MTFVAAIGNVNAAAVLGVATKVGKIARRRRIGRLQESIDIGEVGIGNSLRSERRHFAGGLTNISREVGQSPRRWSECGTDGALAFGAVARGAHVRRERVFAFLSVARRRVLRASTLVLRCAGLRRNK